MKLEEFNYILPKELIAHKPVFPKDSSKLMIVKEKIEHKHFYDILNYLNKDDVLVINETKVKRCKLKGKKESGAPLEIVLLNKIKPLTYEARIKTRNPRIGQKIIIENQEATITDLDKDIFTVMFKQDIEPILEKKGQFPFPPYIQREYLEENEYQPIFAKTEGSVAAPTASLHFTEELLKKIKDKGIIIAKIILHIDYGTFLEITEQNIEDHKMHNEHFEISKQSAEIINNCKGKVIVVGTTALRALEASSKNKRTYPKKATTDIYIYPGYKFQSKAQTLITNFHLPKSSLLILVSAFAGTETIKQAYKEAIKNKYRFYSLGDAMLLSKHQLPKELS
ncbi:MAG: tRNA preQ1(34) S-adenosylmethionine ribosyltransferase-isomerase QueA [Nanoarchaeota archaeon]|nr:tRNA preQ1(34) S-adenosylmethionine ribosyltransferase-isomerase QueA [Nanoarchaeota archaeon]